MARSTLENSQKVAGVLVVLSVLVTWKMNFLCMFSIFCDFESKVSQKCPNRSTLEKCQKRPGHLGFLGVLGVLVTSCFSFFLVLFYFHVWCFGNLVFCI